MKGTCSCPNFTACKHVIGIIIILLYCWYIDYDILAAASCSCDSSRSAYVLSSGSGSGFLQHLFLNLPHSFDLLSEPLTQTVIAGRTDNRTPTTRVVKSTTQQVPPYDHPLSYLLSESEEEEEELTDVKQITVDDQGSKPRSVKVTVAGVPIHGIVDSGADITILSSEMFKRVAAVAKLHKKDFKPPDRTPHNYD